MKMRVIARAYRDQPLDRILVERTPRHAYVAAESALGANDDDDEIGVGFPLGCVFKFDESLYQSLCEAWRAGQVERVAQLWAKAEPIS